MSALHQLVHGRHVVLPSDLVACMPQEWYDTMLAMCAFFDQCNPEYRDTTAAVTFRGKDGRFVGK